MRLFLCLILGLLLIARPGQAATLEDGEQAFAAGRFAEAMAIGTALQNADGDTLFARAALVEAAYLAPEPERETYLRAAEAAARQALQRDPEHVEAMLHLVIALGYRARILGKMAAHRAGLGREARALLDQAAALRPDDPWVWAVLGGWHGEIAATGGFFGRLIYGASAEAADQAFQTALRLDPDNPALAVEYAKMLLRLDPRRHAAAARALLVNEALRPPRTAFERLLADQGAALLRALESGRADEVRAVLRRITPFAG